jgi:hypothetical protein
LSRGSFIDDGLAGSVTRAVVSVLGACFLGSEAAREVAEGVGGNAVLFGDSDWGGGGLNNWSRGAERDFSSNVLALRDRKGGGGLFNEGDTGGGGLDERVEGPTHGREGGGELIRVGTVNLGNLLSTLLAGLKRMKCLALLTPRELTVRYMILPYGIPLSLTQALKEARVNISSLKFPSAPSIPGIRFLRSWCCLMLSSRSGRGARLIAGN